MRDNLEHGWLISTTEREYEEEKESIGECVCCGEEIYEDEEFVTYIKTESGLLCWDCGERRKKYA